MKRSRFTEGWTVANLRQKETGVPVAELGPTSRRYGSWTSSTSTRRGDYETITAPITAICRSKGESEIIKDSSLRRPPSGS